LFCFCLKPYNDDKFLAVIVALFPFVLMLSFIFTVILTSKAIVYEKETGLKEAMKLMGMRSWIYWLSWLIKTFGLLCPSLIFMIVAYKIKINLSSGGQAAIINYTNPLLFAMFIFLYAMNAIIFTFFSSTLFKKANSAAAGTGILWFFSYLPYIFISLRYSEMSLGLKLFACLMPNLAMGQGIILVGTFEGKGTGINFHNWRDKASVDDNFCFFHVILIMLFNNLMYLFLMWYFDKIRPGDHGIAKPWHFLFTQCFTDHEKNNSKGYYNSDDALIDQQQQQQQNHESTNTGIYKKNSKHHHNEIYIEDESEYLLSRRVGIKISKLYKLFKQFGKIKKAVKNLSLNIYEGQITVLLGHNGAGKSTTISMITGKFIRISIIFLFDNIVFVLFFIFLFNFQ
jgi:ATP-binding cassette, subfamily A (ABC1), member 3